MARGENIFRRKDGRWEGRYFREPDEDGKRRYGYLYGSSYEEVKEKLDLVRAQVRERGRNRKASDLLLSVYCDRWLTSRRYRVKESTFNQYCRMVEDHILPRLGKMDVTELDTETIDCFTEALLEDDGLSVSTVREILVQLRAILRMAERFCPGTMRPIEINYPKDFEGRSKRVLTREEQNCLTDALMTDLTPLNFGILLTLHAGLRVGEICALRWENLNLEEKTLEVRNTLQRIRDPDPDATPRTRVVAGPAKTRNARRDIPLNDTTAELCRRMDPGNPEIFVLTGTSQPMEPRTAQYALARIVDVCGLKGVHFHTLRHTFATRCMEQEFEPKALSEILGHANVSTTLQGYVHPSMETKRQNMKKVEGAMQ